MSKNSITILIGSCAAKIGKFLFECERTTDYNYPNTLLSFTDVDIITDDIDILQKLDNSNKYRYDITFYGNDPIFDIIYEYCKTHYTSINKLNILGVEMCICPEKFLYALKKSYIHRIIPYTQVLTNNIDIWFKNMLDYDYLREICAPTFYINYKENRNYKLLDKIFYSEMNNEEDRNDINKTARKIFFDSFDQINKNYGDTNISLDKTDDEFFSDNVIRYYDHDIVHKLVAKYNRNSDELIFERYQKNSLVSLDKDLFFADNLSDHIEMFREEIMVLMLERKMIPIVVGNYMTTDNKYYGYDKKKFKYEIREIIANFATNLCGNGHSWLRNYVLDHLKLLQNYDVNILDNIIAELTGITIHVPDLSKQKINIDKSTILIFFKNRVNSVCDNSKFYQCLPLDSFNNLNKEIIDSVLVKNETTKLIVGNEDKILHLPFDEQFIDLKNYMNDNYISTRCYELDHIIVIYNTYLNFGFAFYIENNVKYNMVFSFNCGLESECESQIRVGAYWMTNIDGNNVDIGGKIAHGYVDATNYYYYSKGINGYCGGMKEARQGGRIAQTKTLNYYGDLPHILNIIIYNIIERFYKVQNTIPDIVEEKFKEKFDEDVPYHEKDCKYYIGSPGYHGEKYKKIDYEGTSDDKLCIEKDVNSYYFL